MHVNPYTVPVPTVAAGGRSEMSHWRDMLEPIMSEHFAGFGKALDGQVAMESAERMRAHQMMRVAMGSIKQGRVVVEHFKHQARMLGLPNEAAVGNSTLVSNVTSFITQMIHMSLEVWPRLISTRLVSVQPFTQPSGYVFFLEPRASQNGDGGTGADRNLADLNRFDKTYGDRGTISAPLQGQQVRAVKWNLSKTLVECKFKALMHQFSWESDVALRSQYGMDLMDMGDGLTANELAWEVDREVVDDLLAFALTNTDGIKYFDPTAGGQYNTMAPSEQKAYKEKFLSECLTDVEIDFATSIYRRPNWILCGANVAKLLGSIEHFTAVDTRSANYDQSLAKGAIIQTGYMKFGPDIWLDPQLDADTAIVGYTDPGDPFYAGYIFCPFGLASKLTAAFEDPDTLLTKKSRGLSFAKVGVRNRQYRVIRLGTGS